jgi:hypothetical protein
MLSYGYTTLETDAMLAWHGIAWSRVKADAQLRRVRRPSLAT